MNRDFIVISFSGERFNSLSQTNQEIICAALAKAIISNMKVSIEDITINTITEEELVKDVIVKTLNEKTDSVVKPVSEEEHAIVYICSKYVHDRVLDRRAFLADLVKSYNCRDKKLSNAVEILSKSSLSYPKLVDKVGVDKIREYHFSEELYDQIRVVRNFILL